MKPLGIDAYRNIVILSGAGISVASGLRPYRGPGGLWEEAGVADGSAFRSRCSADACDLPSFDDDEAHSEGVPQFPRCGSNPDIVLFDEAMPALADWTVKQAPRDCDHFLAVGTSGTVSPASNFVRSAEYSRARTVLVNLEPMKPRNPAYDEEHLGRAEELLPIVLA